MNYAGLISYHKSRQTGTIIEVYDGELQGLDISSGRYYTICKEHGTCICHRTQTLALSHSRDPLGWCEQCIPKGK